MALLSTSTLLAWFDFGVMPPTHWANSRNTWYAGNNGALLVGFGPPYLRTPLDIYAAGALKDGPLGRYSYGRYIEVDTAGVISTVGDVNNTDYYHRAAWTVAILFRPRTNPLPGVLISKRLSEVNPDSHFSLRLTLQFGNLVGKVTSAGGAATTELTITSAYVVGTSYIAYMSKADGAALNIGIKPVGSGSWLTASGGTLTVGWTSGADLVVGRQKTANVPLTYEREAAADVSELCWWHSALNPATEIHPNIEDHFGIADPAGGGGGGGAAQSVFLGGGGLA